MSPDTLESWQRELESLRSAVDFLSGMSERNTESTARASEETLRIAAQQRQIAEKLHEVIVHQQELHQWIVSALHTSEIPEILP
ncbi:MAG TPA: hypothetical protein VJK52_03095, partial [Candidatus Nanoarchaeia archaeon]|nr:hypothetical protein [Candidatus Nanoarchaeia archaeon]